MPGHPDCPRCPFASDPETTCVAVRTGHRPFCHSTHPAMPEAVRKLTLQLDGRWVEPEPEPPSPVEPTPYTLPMNPYRAQMAAVQGCLYGEAPSCGCAAKRKCWKVGEVVPLRTCYECIPLGKK